MKHCILVIFLFATGHIIVAQQKIAIQFITNNTVKIFGEYLVVNDSNNTIDAGIINSNGIVILNAKKQHLKISVTIYGYLDTNILINSPEPENLLVPIYLIQKNGIRVTGKKPVVQFGTESTVVNVANSVLSAVSNAADVIKRLPGITVNGKTILLAGVGDALVYIQNVQTPIEQLISMPANRINKIEILSNPPAKYNAGSKAVILVHLKKTDAEGWQSTVSPYFTIAHHLLYGGNLSNNLRRKKINLVVDFGKQFGTDWNTNNYFSTFNYPNNRYKTNAFYEEHSNNKNILNYKLGISYNITPKSSFGIQYDGLFNDFRLDVKNNSNQLLNEAETGKIFMKNNAQTINVNHSINTNFSQVLDSNNSNIFIGLQYNNFETQLHDKITETIVNKGVNAYSANRENNGMNNIYMYTFQIDAQQFFLNNINIDYGIKLNKVINKSKIEIRSKLETDNNWNNLGQFANQFKYEEIVPAAYFSANKKWNKIKLYAGMRAEFSDINGFSFKYNKSILDTQYLNFFPSIKLSYSNKKVAQSIGFSRRINRPFFQDIDPFLWYLDSLTAITGNSKLQAEITNAIEYRLKIKNWGFSVGQNFTTNAIRQILKVGNAGVNSVIYTKGNISQFNSTNVSVDYNLQIKRVTSYFKLLGYYNSVSKKNTNFVTFNPIPFAYFYNNTDIEFYKKWNLNLFGELYSTRGDGNVKFDPYYYISSGLSRNFLNDDLQFQLIFNDIFRTARIKGFRTIGNVSTNFNQRFNTSYFRVNITYTFGRLRQINYNNKTINDKDLGRIKM